MIVKLETKYKIDDVVECEDMFGHKCHGTVWGAYAEDDSVFYILKDVVHEKDKRIEKKNGLFI